MIMTIFSAGLTASEMIELIIDLQVQLVSSSQPGPSDVTQYRTTKPLDKVGSFSLRPKLTVSFLPPGVSEAVRRVQGDGGG